MMDGNMIMSVAKAMELLRRITRAPFTPYTVTDVQALMQDTARMISTALGYRKQEESI